MFSHILIATDGSRLSNAAVDHGALLAKSIGARITVLTVLHPFLGVHAHRLTASARSEREREAHEHADEALARALNAAEAAGAPCQVRKIEASEVYRAIVDTAKALGCDLIVMASHGRRGLSALVLGSETNKVLTHSPISVLVWRREPPPTIIQLT